MWKKFLWSRYWVIVYKHFKIEIYLLKIFLDPLIFLVDFQLILQHSNFVFSYDTWMTRHDILSPNAAPIYYPSMIYGNTCFSIWQPKIGILKLCVCVCVFPILLLENTICWKKFVFATTLFLVHKFSIILLILDFNFDYNTFFQLLTWWNTSKFSFT